MWLQQVSSSRGLIVFNFNNTWQLLIIPGTRSLRRNYDNEHCTPGIFISTLTWDQALFLFCFENYTFWRVRWNEKRAWYKPSTKRLPPTFLIDWHLPNQPIRITSVACFSSMQIFHEWEKCRLADLKNSFYLLIFSAKNKTVSTITFNFLRD